MKRKLFGHLFRNSEPGTETASTPEPTPTTETVKTPNGQPINIHLHNPVTPPIQEPTKTPVPTPEKPSTESTPTPVTTGVSSEILMKLAGVPDFIQPLIANQSVEQLANYLVSDSYKTLVERLTPAPAPKPEETTVTEPAPKPEAKGKEPPSGDTKPEATSPKTFAEIKASDLNLFKTAFLEI